MLAAGDSAPQRTARWREVRGPFTLRDLHERMPVILAPADYDTWLDRRIEEPAHLQHLLEPCGEDELIAKVNRVANDDASLIALQRSLF